MTFATIAQGHANAINTQVNTVTEVVLLSGS